MGIFDGKEYFGEEKEIKKIVRGASEGGASKEQIHRILRNTTGGSDATDRQLRDYDKIAQSYYKNKGGKSKGGCFITTAVCSTLGKPDDCEELTFFRKFRDDFMLESAEMRSEVEEYYEIAPRICEAIESNGPVAASKKYFRIWSVSLKPAFEALIAGETQKAHDIYRQMVMELKKEYIGG
jgi:hypothetical protein